MGAKKQVKTISISEDAYRLLIKLSKTYHKPESLIVEELIKEKVKDIDKRLRVFKELTDNVSVYFHLCLLQATGRMSR